MAAYLSGKLKRASIMQSRCSMLVPALSRGWSEGCTWLGVGLGLGTEGEGRVVREY